MRTIYMLTYFFVTAGALTACSVKSDVKLPDGKYTYKAPDVDALLEKYYTCDKKDSEQPLLANDVLDSKVTLDETLELVTYEEIDCDNKVSKSYSAVRTNYKKIIAVLAPPIDQPVEFVTVENFRTCETININTVADEKLGGISIVNPDKTVMVLAPVDSEAGKSGNLNLNLTDSTVKLVPGLSITNGKNHLQIKYRGKCLQEETTETGKKCLVFEELANQYLLVEANINYVNKTDEKIPVDVCKKTDKR